MPNLGLDKIKGKMYNSVSAISNFKKVFSTFEVLKSPQLFAQEEQNLD